MFFTKINRAFGSQVFQTFYFYILERRTQKYVEQEQNKTDTVTKPEERQGRIRIFLVEGNKMVEEALRSEYQIETLVCTAQFADQHPEIRSKAKEVIEADRDSIQKPVYFKIRRRHWPLSYNQS